MQSVEQRLVELIKRGDRASQRELYDRYGGRLLAISMRYIGSREQAEDNLHDSFIKILRSIGGFSYRGEGSLRAWMERITINTALEWLRSHKRLQQLSQSPVTDDLVEIPEPVDVEAIPPEVLMGFVGELADGYRTVFNLFCIEGYSHREIAERLGINEKSSSSQLLRARRQLAARIKEYISRDE